MGLLGKLIGAIITGAGMIILAFGWDQSLGPVSLIFIAIGLFVTSLGMALITGGKQQTQKPRPPTITEIKCDNPECTFKELRDFELGDYIFKTLDVSCPKCGSSMTIHGIYIVRDESENKISI